MEYKSRLFFFVYLGELYQKNITKNLSKFLNRYFFIRSTVAKSQVCDANHVCLWNQETGKCGQNRDKFNNVCVPANADGTPADINVICHALTSGKCPRKYEVSLFFKEVLILEI